jgi:hypothetical protein
VRNAIAGIISAQTVVVQTQITQLQATLAALDVALIPVQLAQEVAQTTVDAIRAMANLVPVQLMAGCGDLGNFMVRLNTSLDIATADLNAVIAKANRELSFRDEVSAEIDELNELLTTFSDISLELVSC